MTFVVTATWTAKKGEGERVLASIKKLINPSRSEPGNRYFQPSRDPEQPDVFFFEIFDDEAAYELHRASPHFAEYAVGEAFPLLEARERRFWTALE